MAEAIFDEMGKPGGEVRRAYRILQAWLDETPHDILTLRREEAETVFRRIGITFAVYGEGGDRSASFLSTSFPAFWKRRNGGRFRKGLSSA